MVRPDCHHCRVCDREVWWMKRLTSNQIRELVGKLYWTAHTDGRLHGKRALRQNDYGIANLTIESFATQLGARPTRTKKAAK